MSIKKQHLGQQEIILKALNVTNKSNMLVGYQQFSQECSLFKLHTEMRSKVLDMCVGYVGFFSINGKMYSSSLICADSRGGMLHKSGKSIKGIPV